MQNDRGGNTPFSTVCKIIWLSSARAVKCRVKSITSATPILVASGSAGDSRETASVSCEEGGDDVKSSRPLRPATHVLQWWGQQVTNPRG